MAEKVAETGVVWGWDVIGGTDGWESYEELREWKFAADVTAGTGFVWGGGEWSYRGDEKDFATSADEFGD
jgi:hypothetical protein